MTLEANQRLHVYVVVRCLKLQLCGMKKPEQLVGMI